MSQERESGYHVGETSCPACGSNDNLKVYLHEDSEGNQSYDAFCFGAVCRTYFDQEKLNELGAAQEYIDGAEKVDTATLKSKSNRDPITREEFMDLWGRTKDATKQVMYRGIRPEIRQKFSHLIETDSRGNVQFVYYPETRADREELTGLMGYKSRFTPKKRFGWRNLGKTGQSNELSGQKEFRNINGKYILIVGGECYADDTEVFTEKGWVKFPDLKVGTKVAQVDQQGNATFVEPLSFTCTPWNGELINYTGRYSDTMVTPKHKMFTYAVGSGKPRTHEAAHPASIAENFRQVVQLSGNGVNLSDEQLKFIVALSADSKVDERKSGKRVAHFSLIKDRKIKRLTELLDSLGMEYTSYGKEGRNWVCGRKYHTFNVTLEHWCLQKGLPLNWATELTLSQKETILSEIPYWDGNFVKERDAFEFSAKELDQCELVRDIALTSGKWAALRHRRNDLGEWYCVKISGTKQTASYQSLDIKSVQYSGLVYCVTVPSGLLYIRRNGKPMVCGNCDQVSAYQMLYDAQKDKSYDSIPVVSPTCGEGSAVKQIAAQYDFIDQFDWIIIGMDNDEAGHKATEAICQVLPKDKVKIAKWSMKDPNEMLQAGKEKQFVRDFYSAEELHKSGVKDSLDALNEVEEFLTAEKITLPPYMHRIQENMRGGIKTTGHIGNVIGDTSIGKTFLTDNMLLHWILTSPVIPTIVSLERTAGEMGADLLSIYLKKNLTWFKDGMEAVDYLHLPEVQDKKMELFVDDEGKKRFYIIDEREGDVPTLMRQIERVSKKYDSKLVIFDPLTDLLRSLGTEAQEDFMKWEKFMKKEGFIFINVLHTRKPMPDKEGRIRDVGEYDALGSSTFPQSADWNMVINRDKNAEDPVERNTTRVSLPKIRGGTTGHAADLYYDTETRQQYDKEDWMNGVYDVAASPMETEEGTSQEADIFGGDFETTG